MTIADRGTGRACLAPIVLAEVVDDPAAVRALARRSADVWLRPVVPKGVYMNLGTPWEPQPVMHTDLPQFRGINQDDVPGWFLQCLGASRLFEAERINSVTAVA